MADVFDQISNYSRKRENGWTALVHQQFESVDLLSLVRRLPGADNAEPVVSSDTAEVYRCSVRVGDQAVVLYIKEYLMRSGIDRIKHIFRPSRAQRAFSAGMMLAANQLHSPDIVGVIEKRNGPVCERNFLITQEMPNARPVYSFFEKPPANRAALHRRRKLITELGETIGRMHRAGILHGDLRGGNLFISDTDTGRPFYFIDNERTRQYRHLPFDKRIKNLVQLNMLRYTITKPERMRFFRAYCRSAGLDRKSSRPLARTVMRQTEHRFGKRSKTRIGLPPTAAQDHWDFQCIRVADHRGIFLTPLINSVEKDKLIQHIESLMQNGEVFKDDTATRVVRCTWDDRDIVIKRYNHQGLWHSFRHTIKGSRARKSWVFGHRLNQHAIATAQPLGFLEQRKFGLVWQSYIFNAFVDGPQLHAVMNLPGHSETERRQVMQKAGQLLEKLGRSRLIHADMKPANMIICDGQPVLIDLDSMERHTIRWYFRYRYQKMVNYFHRRVHGKKKPPVGQRQENE